LYDYVFNVDRYSSRQQTLSKVKLSSSNCRPSTSLYRLIRAQSRQSSRWIFYEKTVSLSARGASFHTKHASNANVVRVVLLDANSYLPLWTNVVGYGPFFLCVMHKEGLCPNNGDINRLMDHRASANNIVLSV
jgi:hypothetical protein